MPLVFSPLTENIIDTAPRRLLPQHAFLMRQLGDPPILDVEMTRMVKSTFKRRFLSSIDAADTIGQNDFLERILGLMRSTGFTVAIFSHETRPETLANIMLEMGFAAMCGKPLLIVKSATAKAQGNRVKRSFSGTFIVFTSSTLQDDTVLLPLQGEGGSAEGRDGWGRRRAAPCPGRSTQGLTPMDGAETPSVAAQRRHLPLAGEGARRLKGIDQDALNPAPRQGEEWLARSFTRLPCAKAPSDLTRTDWIIYEPGEAAAFKKKLGQAVDEILALIDYESLQIDVALDAPMVDCATAPERANKAFLLSGEHRFADAAKRILGRLNAVGVIEGIGDLNRIRGEADMFVRQAEAAVVSASRRKAGRGRRAD